MLSSMGNIIFSFRYIIRRKSISFYVSLKESFLNGNVHLKDLFEKRQDSLVVGVFIKGHLLTDENILKQNIIITIS